MNPLPSPPKKTCTRTRAIQVSKNVRDVFVMGSGGITSAPTLFHNEFMTAGTATPAAIPGFGPRMKTSIGPELGIGFALGDYTTDPVMTLKTCKPSLTPTPNSETACPELVFCI